MELLILNGPNLNLVGKREPKVYGLNRFSDFFNELQKKYKPLVKLYYFQSNCEGELLDKIQELGFTYNGIIFNAGAYSHTSIALRDVIASISSSVIEVHISNVHNREQFRHFSMIAPVCKGVISGFGLKGYELAIKSFLD